MEWVRSEPFFFFCFGFLRGLPCISWINCYSYLLVVCFTELFMFCSEVRRTEEVPYLQAGPLVDESLEIAQKNSQRPVHPGPNKWKFEGRSYLWHTSLTLMVWLRCSHVWYRIQSLMVAQWNDSWNKTKHIHYFEVEPLKSSAAKGWKKRRYGYWRLGFHVKSCGADVQRPKHPITSPWVFVDTQLNTNCIAYK